MTDPVLEVAFLGGIDEAAREEIVDPAVSFTTLENLRQNHRGGAEKRLGYAAMSTTRLDGTNRTSGRRCFANGGQLCVIDGTYLDVQSDAASRSILKNRVPEATYRLLEAPTAGIDATVADIAYCNGYVVLSHPVTLTDGSPEQHAASVLDAATGTVVMNPVAVYPGALGSMMGACRLATYSTYVLAFTLDVVTDNIDVSYLDLATPATISAGWQYIATIATDCNGERIDVSSFTDRVAVGYYNTSGGASRVTVKTLDISGVLETTTINTSSTNPADVGLSEDGSVLWVVWGENQTIKAIGLTPTSLSTVVSTAATIFTAPLAMPNRLYVAYRTATTAVAYAWLRAGGASAAPGGYLVVQQFGIVAGATTADGSLISIYNARPQGRPFARGTDVYMPMSSSHGAELVLCDSLPPSTGAFVGQQYYRPVAAPIYREILFDRAIEGGFQDAPCMRCVASSSTKYLYAFAVKRSGSTSGVSLCEFDFASSQRWKTAALNGSTFIGGGVTSVFDGVRVFESAFLCRPRRVEISTNAAGALTFTLGGRKYVATYEDIDADGNWHISGVSIPSSATGDLTNNNQVIKLTPLSISSRGAPQGRFATGLRVGIWATADGGVEPYYRLGEVPNDPNSSELLYTDNTPDNTLTSRPLLYSTGNLPGTGASQDHRAPPGLLHIVSYNGMLVGAAGKQYFFSGQPIDGEGTWFSPLFAGTLDAEITGITVQDGALLFFTRDAIWSASGDPPSDNGLQGGLSTPRRLAVELGCIDGNSVLTTRIGTFFQSARGIELLTRGNVVQPIGDKIQDTLASYPVVAAAVLDAEHGLAIFSLAASRTDGVVSASGRDIVFDLDLGVWISRDAKVGNAASQDACVAYVEDAWRYCWLDDDGTVYYRRSSGDASAHLDGATWVTQKAITSWAHIAGLNGEQFIDQVLLLAKRVTGHDLTIALAFDYSDTFTSIKTFTAAQIAALARQWLVKEVEQTTSNAIRVSIEDATPSSGSVGSGRGATWVCLTLNGLPHRGPKRTSGAQRGGS